MKSPDFRTNTYGTILGLLYERYRYPAVEQATQPDESGESEGSDVISAAAKPSQSQSDSDLPAEEAYNEKPSIREPPSTELCPSLPTSVTMPPIPADKHGEDLQRLSETEWETGEQAFPNEFINLNREEDRISVYAAPEKTTEHLLKLEEKRRKKLMEMLKRPEPPSSSESSGEYPLLFFVSSWEDTYLGESDKTGWINIPGYYDHCRLSNYNLASTRQM
ncbi:hypothetical protein Q1695_015440 [Nippostrongylus brasiliensis]|nr:hypothetical protein Q1695_015440 [Nippostrongylus brasiliensis]